MQPTLLHQHLTVRNTDGCWTHQTQHKLEPEKEVKKKNLCIYRSWVPDEDLGAAVGELVCRDLQVIHQNLYALPAVSQRSQGSLNAHFMTFYMNIKRQFQHREEERVTTERLMTKQLLLTEKTKTTNRRAERLHDGSV